MGEARRSLQLVLNETTEALAVDMAEKLRLWQIVQRLPGWNRDDSTDSPLVRRVLALVRAAP